MVAGHVGVSLLDQADGFVHLSQARQVQGTIDRFFSKNRQLHLFRFPVGELGADLKWEGDAKGELFPHFYNHLLVTLSDQEYLIDRSDPDHMSTIGSLP